jgi:hypothetical protein
VLSSNGYSCRNSVPESGLADSPDMIMTLDLTALSV